MGACPWGTRSGGNWPGASWLGGTCPGGTRRGGGVPQRSGTCGVSCPSPPGVGFDDSGWIGLGDSGVLGCSPVRGAGVSGAKISIFTGGVDGLLGAGVVPPGRCACEAPGPPIGWEGLETIGFDWDPGEFGLGALPEPLGAVSAGFGAGAGFGAAGGMGLSGLGVGFVIGVVVTDALTFAKDLDSPPTAVGRGAVTSGSSLGLGVLVAASPELATAGTVKNGIMPAARDNANS